MSKKAMYGAQEAPTPILGAEGKNKGNQKGQEERGGRMTERELMALRFIRAQIERLEERIGELEAEDGIGSLNMDGMPHGTTPGNPVERMAIARVALHEKLVNLKATKLEKEREIREYIETVEPYDVKCIMEMRFIDLMDWYDIAAELEEITGKSVDRTTPAKKMRKYLSERATSPNFPAIPV